MIDLQQINGLYVGQLNADELELFERAVVAGRAMREYNSFIGLMGVAKVLVLDSGISDQNTEGAA